MSTPKKRRGKQHDIRAASFVRLAKDCRAEAKRQQSMMNRQIEAHTLRLFATLLNYEAKRLQRMR